MSRHLRSRLAAALCVLVMVAFTYPAWQVWSGEAIPSGDRSWKGLVGGILLLIGSLGLALQARESSDADGPSRLVGWPAVISSISLGIAAMLLLSAWAFDQGLF